MAHKGKMLELACGVSSRGRNMICRGEARLGDPCAVGHAGLEESTRMAGHGRQQLLDKGSRSWLESCRRVQVADQVARCLSLESGYSPEQMSNSAHNSVQGLAIHGRSARMPGYSAAKARGHRPATPRWSPHFRTMSVCAVCALLGLDDDVHVRWSVDGALLAVAPAPVEALRLSADDDLKCEAVKQNPRVQSLPRTRRPNFPRSRQADRNNRDCRLWMTVRRRVRRERPRTPRRQ